MRIDAYNQIQQVYGTQKAAKYDSKNTSVSKFADQLQLSQEAHDAAVAQKAVSATPDVREDLVNSLKERIDNGTYEVSAEDFASKILEKYNGLF
jgi:negative regulator of flagellin synthesis FlgM